MSVSEKRKLDGHRARCEDVVRQTRLPKITLHRAFLKCTETLPPGGTAAQGRGRKASEKLVSVLDVVSAVKEMPDWLRGELRLWLF